MTVDYGGEHAYTQELQAKIKQLTAENKMLREGDTCARMCEGTAYRIEARRLRSENELLRNHLNAILYDMRETDKLQSAAALAAEATLRGIRD